VDDDNHKKNIYMFTLNNCHHPHTDKAKTIYMFTLYDYHHPHTDKVKNIYMFTLNDIFIQGKV
jgi:hypothetical protein